MLAIGLELLTGRYVATAYNDRSVAEWPPHPARFFSALVATWQDADPAGHDGEVELLALRYLEGLPAPVIQCSGLDDAARRSAPQVFVPVNDVATVSEPNSSKLEAAEEALAAAADERSRKKASADVEKLRKKLLDDTAKVVAAPPTFTADRDLGARVLPEGRTKQPRTFPSVTPTCPAVAFVWRDEELAAELKSGLVRLLRRLVRLGHSSSMVAARLLDDGEVAALSGLTTSFVPDDVDGRHVIRWVGRGQVERLGRAFELHKEVEPRVLPAAFVRYREGLAPTVEKPRAGVFAHHDMIVFARVGGPRLPMTSTVGVARQFRKALIAAARDDVPPLLSGHAADGASLDATHLAFVPLPVVGHPYADGAILGVGLVFPRDCSADERRRVLAAIGRLEQATPGTDDPPVVHLMLGSSGVLELQRVGWGEDGRTTLQPGWWARSSKTWASATPVALDRHPGNLHDEDPVRRKKAFDEARDSIALAVRRAGYPEPVELDVVRSCVLPGSVKPRAFPRYPVESDRPQRVLVHTRIAFPSSVQGPLLLGAGRYFGLGLHLPVDTRSGGSGATFQERP
jgi:CRISPR-associated protein Csb2